MDGLESYSVLFVSGLLSLCIPLGLFLVSIFLFPRKQSLFRRSQLWRARAPLNPAVLGQRINVRFFLAVNAALVLITLAIELIPCSLTLQMKTSGSHVKGLFAIITVAGFAALGLLYAVRKGDMGWLSSFRSDGSKTSMKS